jgi:hypothetical protein
LAIFAPRREDSSFSLADISAALGSELCRAIQGEDRRVRATCSLRCGGRLSSTSTIKCAALRLTNAGSGRWGPSTRQAGREAVTGQIGRNPAWPPQSGRSAAMRVRQLTAVSGQRCCPRLTAEASIQRGRTPSAYIQGHSFFELPRGVDGRKRLFPTRYGRTAPAVELSRVHKNDALIESAMPV